MGLCFIFGIAITELFDTAMPYLLLILQALEWLKSYYWEPQEKKFHTQINQTSSLRKEIKRRLHEVSVSLKAKQVAKSSSSHVNIKR